MSRVDQAFRRASLGPSSSEGPSPVVRTTPDVDEAVLNEYPSEQPSRQPAAGGQPIPSPGRTATPAGRKVAAPAPAIAQVRAVTAQTPDVLDDAHRDLAGALNKLQTAKGINALMVSSALPGEGRTFTATHLAFALGEPHQKKVLLIDADLRNPRIHEVLGVPASKGLSDGLRSDAPRLSLFQVSPHVAFLPAGSVESHPMDMLASQAMRNLILEAASRFDWVLLDTPPLSLLPEAHLLAWMTDGVVLVVRAGVTPYRQVQRAIDNVGEERVIGTVLNRATGRR